MQPKADIQNAESDVRYVPTSDILIDGKAAFL